MKIGIVLDDSLDYPDGVQQYVLTLGAWLTSKKHTVHYLVGQTSRTDIAGIKSLSRNVAVSFNGNRMRIPLPTSKKMLRTLLKTEQYDVLHVQMPYSPFLAHRLIMAAPHRTAVVGTFHIVAYSKVVDTANKLLGAALRSSLKRFDAVMAVSKPAAELAKQAYHSDSRVIPNLVDTSRFVNAPKKKSPVPKVVYLGRLVERKGCKLLLEAVSLAQKRRPDLTFETIIGGKGPLKEQLESYAKEKDIKQLSFAGFVDETDKPTFLAAADISVFPSTGGESFGIILVEAMASGQSAVLAGDNSGYRTVLEQQPEALFDPHDASGLADKLITYLDDRALRRQLAERQAASAALFDQNILGPRVVAVYRECLRSRAAASIIEG